MNCDLGVGCDETGICYAMAHGKPEMCGAKAIEARKGGDSATDSIHESAARQGSPKGEQP